MEPLGIDGAWTFTPRIFGDSRGAFLEAYRGAAFEESVGHSLSVAQTNVSVSRRGTLRGIHFADVPPGQAKYVMCVRGAVLDVVADIRVGSPTFGTWRSVQLDDEDRRAVYIAEGLGHAFFALTDDATVVYLCSEPFRAEREHGVDPLDPTLAIEWPSGIEPILSEKDAGAPSLEEAREAGLLPSYDACQAFYLQLRDEA